ncbi:MAG: DUF7666 domain-containing protein [Brevundimonas sp.]|uniref:DUF7666 domain-containing protein n=2 Tax=Brevundimonas sp. TaxID=1871086 RepID=UPI004034E378
MARTKKTDAPEAQPVIAFKGTDKDIACRGYQFEVGKTFEHKGHVEACRSGFHACENPFDVWSYYGLGDGNRFFRVSLAGELARHAQDSKIAAGRITFDAELRLPDFVEAAVAYVINLTRPQPVKAGASPKVDEDGARIGSSGYGARIGSSGYGARIGSSGNGAQIGSSGNDARIGSSGYGARIGSSGNDAQIGSSGNDAQIGSSGYGAQIGSSGYGAQIGSSGYGARIGSSGYGARIGSSGYGAQIGSSGYGAQIDATGENAVIACSGSVYRIRAGEGGAICVPHHDGKRVRFIVAYVGEAGIKAGTWYAVSDGKLVEVSA